MDRTELAVWSLPGEAPLRGEVLKRTSATGPVLVRWQTGREEKVKARDPSVRFAFDGTHRLGWLLDPESLRTRFAEMPTEVIFDVLRDAAGEFLTTAVIKRRLVEVGLDGEAVAEALAAAKATLKTNWHVLVDGTKYAWSDLAVDPHAALRALKPLDALERLVHPAPKMSQAERDALGAAVAAGLAG
jgi:hypothetical protein